MGHPMSTASSFHPVDLNQWLVDARDAGAVEVWGAVCESGKLYCKANWPLTRKNTAVQDHGELSVTSLRIFLIRRHTSEIQLLLEATCHRGIKTYKSLVESLEIFHSDKTLGS